jgi:hypothetical protein
MAKKIFEEERDWADSVQPFMMSHAKLCKAWWPALYASDEPDIGIWKKEFGKMKRPKNIPRVNYDQYHMDEKDATEEELKILAKLGNETYVLDTIPLEDIGQ